MERSTPPPTRWRWRRTCESGSSPAFEQNPSNVDRLYSGTQDNGTLRKSASAMPAGGRWFDVPSGDGGQTLVEPNRSRYVYGAYFGISPYRYSDGLALTGPIISNTSQASIQSGINTADQQDSISPGCLTRATTSACIWAPIGCIAATTAARPGPPSRATSPVVARVWPRIAQRGCVIGAIGVTAGASAVYVGTLDG